MSLEILNRISADELTLFFVGGVLLIIIPPLVGLFAAWILFGAPARSTTIFLRRLVIVTVLCVSIAAILGFAGVYLLEPASPQAVWLTLGIAFIFGLLGAGKLYWEEESIER